MLTAHQYTHTHTHTSYSLLSFLLPPFRSGCAVVVVVIVIILQTDTAGFLLALVQRKYFTLAFDSNCCL